MLGHVDAPGNVFVDGLDGDDPLEWNAYADPSAVAAVFATDVPIDLVPLDATDDVPVPADLPKRLAEDHAAAGADLLHELLLRHPDAPRRGPGPAALGRARRSGRRASPSWSPGSRPRSRSVTTDA